MAHTPTTLAILRGSARFTRVGLLVALVTGLVPLAYGAAHLALGTAGAGAFVAGSARSFLVVAYLVLVGWVVTGWFLDEAKREAGRLNGCKRN